MPENLHEEDFQNVADSEQRDDRLCIEVIKNDIIRVL